MEKINTDINLDADLMSESQEQIPNSETRAAMAEYYEMKKHPEKYKRYFSFREGSNEVLADA